jgi:hypothetical protein
MSCIYTGDGEMDGCFDAEYGANVIRLGKF